jgi:nicotinate-nucleotide adenylyltransferase
MRIGILGGKFDPIHKGHEALAAAAARELKLDRVMLVPVYQHPLADSSKTMSAAPKDRLEMVRCAIQGNDKLEASDCEIARGGASYTGDTLRELKTKHPNDELFFITGGDWGQKLEHWKDIDAVFSLATFVVASRPGFDLKSLPKEVRALQFRPLDISSTQIRQNLQQGKTVDQWISQKVLHYIHEHQLYRS